MYLELRESKWLQKSSDEKVLHEGRRALGARLAQVQGHQDVGVAVPALRLLQCSRNLQQCCHAWAVVVEAGRVWDRVPVGPDNQDAVSLGAKVGTCSRYHLVFLLFLTLYFHLDWLVLPICMQGKLLMHSNVTHVIDNKELLTVQHLKTGKNFFLL